MDQLVKCRDLQGPFSFKAPYVPRGKIAMLLGKWCLYKIYPINLYFSVIFILQKWASNHPVLDYTAGFTASGQGSKDIP